MIIITITTSIIIITISGFRTWLSSSDTFAFLCSLNAHTVCFSGAFPCSGSYAMLYMSGFVSKEVRPLICVWTSIVLHIPASCWLACLWQQLLGQFLLPFLRMNALRLLVLSGSAAAIQKVRHNALYCLLMSFVTFVLYWLSLLAFCCVHSPWMSCGALERPSLSRLLNDCIFLNHVCIICGGHCFRLFLCFSFGFHSTQRTTVFFRAFWQSIVSDSFNNLLWHFLWFSRNGQYLSDATIVCSHHRSHAIASMKQLSPSLIISIVNGIHLSAHVTSTERLITLSFQAIVTICAFESDSPSGKLVPRKSQPRKAQDAQSALWVLVYKN